MAVNQHLYKFNYQQYARPKNNNKKHGKHKETEKKKADNLSTFL